MAHTPGFGWAFKPTLEIKAMGGGEQGHRIGLSLLHGCVCARGKRTTGHRPFLWGDARWCKKAALGGWVVNARVERRSLSRARACELNAHISCVHTWKCTSSYCGIWDLGNLVSVLVAKQQFVPEPPTLLWLTHAHAHFLLYQRL